MQVIFKKQGVTGLIGSDGEQNVTVTVNPVFGIVGSSFGFLKCYRH